MQHGTENEKNEIPLSRHLPVTNIVCNYKFDWFNEERWSGYQVTDRSVNFHSERKMPLNEYFMNYFKKMEYVIFYETVKMYN